MNEVVGASKQIFLKAYANSYDAFPADKGSEKSQQPKLSGISPSTSQKKIKHHKYSIYNTLFKCAPDGS